MCCRLQELEVPGCYNMTDRGLLEGIGSLQGLTSLCLTSGTRLTAQALSTFLHRPFMTSIMLLDVSSCPNLDDKGLEGIAERCNKLTYFSYLNVLQVSVCGCEVSLLCVCVYRCVQLKELKVCQCNSITDAGISMVISNCTQLCVLDLRGLDLITGMCAVCEIPETTLPFITLCCMIFLQFITDHECPPLDHIVSLYNAAHLHKLSSNHPIYSMLQSHPITIHISNHIAETCCVSLIQYCTCFIAFPELLFLRRI
jgi:hypothetical protein